MYKVCSIFSQVLKLFPRGEFEQAVKEHKAERHARGFTSWGQFMAMLFCQLGRAHSLREICGGLACCEGQLKHLGVPVAPKRSTLAYANEHRPWELYQTVFEQTLYQMPGTGAKPGRAEEVPFQEQADEPGREHHRPVGEHVRLGQVPADQGRHQAAPAAGPRWLLAVVRGGDRGQDQRNQGGAHAAVRTGHDPGHRSRLQRLRAGFAN